MKKQRQMARVSGTLPDSAFYCLGAFIIFIVAALVGQKTEFFIPEEATYMAYGGGLFFLAFLIHVIVAMIRDVQHQKDQDVNGI